MNNYAPSSRASIVTEWNDNAVSRNSEAYHSFSSPGAASSFSSFHPTTMSNNNSRTSNSSRAMRTSFHSSGLSKTSGSYNKSGAARNSMSYNYVPGPSVSNQTALYYSAPSTVAAAYSYGMTPQ